LRLAAHQENANRMKLHASLRRDIARMKKERTMNLTMATTLFFLAKPWMQAWAT
jgi:hypothetical protein